MNEKKMLLTRKAAAQVMSISVDTLDCLPINRIKIGARVYYRPEALREYITKKEEKRRA